jgi:hypothetical protein|tara:strand:+ start:334 stop:567 length:234 start_codon:yes stop_codon:yes gene_type:complete
MANIKFRFSNLVPKAKIVAEAFWIGLSVSIVAFVLDFFGLDFILNFLPDGLKIFAIVMIGVYLRSLFDLKIFGKEVL